MPLLEAFLALALTMLSLATIATVGVEMVHRILHVRGRDLERMLHAFYKTELQEIVNSHFNLAGKAIDKKRNEIIDELISNPLVPEQTGWLAKLSKLFSWFKLRDRLKDLTTLSTDDMLKRLQKTPAGEALLAKGEDQVNVLLDNVIAKYDQYGVVATDLFKRRAQTVSLVAGIVVAFMLNVDAMLMFQTYLQDPETRFAVMSNAESITKSWEKVNDGVTRAKELGQAAKPPATEQKSGAPPAVAGEPASAEFPTKNAIEFVSLQGTQVPDAPKQPASPDALATQTQENLDAIKSDLASIKTMAAGLQNDIRAPLGYQVSDVPLTFVIPLMTTFGFMEADKSKEIAGASKVAGDAKADALSTRRNIGYLLLWCLRVLVSGLLIGLGGPFWFNIVRTLMSVSGRGSAPAAAQDGSSSSFAAMRAPPTPHPAFHTGAKAYKLVSSPADGGENESS